MTATLDGTKHYQAARKVICTAVASSAVACFSGVIGWWAFLPLLFVQIEVSAFLYDKAIVGHARKKSSFIAPNCPEDSAFTWQEVAQHNSEDSAWVAIDGLVYDVTDFIDKHPGGREMLLLSVGREASDLFASYHPFTDKPRSILKKYCIGSLATYEHPIYKPDSGFYKEACDTLKSYFEQNNIDSKNPYTGFVRMMPVYVLFTSLYFGIYYIHGIPLAARAAMAILMGMCQGMPLTGWMHDASHASIGWSERWWWAIGRFALDYISGSSMLSWRNQHVIGHHVYTNVMGADPDLPTCVTGDPRRLVPEQAWSKIYQYQHIYLPPLYGILGIKSRIQDFSEVFSKLMNGPVRVNPISTQDYLRLISSKSCWVFYRIVVPYVFFSATKVQNIAILVLLTEFATGYWLAFNFQVSHISTDVEYLFSDTKKRESGKCPAIIDSEWAHMQIKTTIDYAHNKAIPTYLSGALNYQTTHHLFPTVSQYHYPAITPIIMKIAEKHGLKFNIFDSFHEALAAHIEHLRVMGSAGKAAELKLE